MLPSPQALWRWLRQWRREHLQVDRFAVLQHVDEAGALAPRFAFMVVMSCGIATLGLLQGSAAVIIGAMLISPLMGPIVEMGMSLAVFDLRNLRGSLRTLAVGVALSLLIAILIVAVSPLQEPTAEILARTEPTLFDLLVAVFSGLAGAYATITRKGETIVGVAIATALMPPLAVVGFGIATGSASIAGGAAFLFMTNLLAIALSVTVMARWYHFGRSDSPQQTAWQAALIVGTFALLSIPLGLALRDIAARGLAERSIRTTLEAAAREVQGQITALRVEQRGRDVQVDAMLLTPRYAAGLATQLERTLETQLGRPVVLALREVLTADDSQIAREQATLSQLRDSVDELRTAASREAQQRRGRDDAMAALRERASAYLGPMETLGDGQRVLWRLRADTLDLRGARALEAALAGSAQGPAVEVIPPLQPLPQVVFADDSVALDDTAQQQLADAAWALQRWQAPTAHLHVQGGDTGPGRARAAAIADALRALGVTTTTIDYADRNEVRTHAAAPGQVGLRTVALQAGVR
ncbi:DUF389 domain-containing protein [Lysobacter solisilvae (ex Woo and Kim 2020)]|uniref:DUF389 domain-containing protein n=1 Tax=Agrilutibacter terrestris TaxID=2865112 RepID=UPI001ABB14F6|nr:DUF389 domain-containing protein [Lysobacter terrestris]